jgi:hypothetical protein
MAEKILEATVALFVFNRPDTTCRVFAAIAHARPARLLLVADGPRTDRPEEAEACQQVREIVSRVDWPCEVSTNFSEINLGCRERIISGLDWVFSLVEEAIILEDDCLPDASFFPFCEELLEKYRGDARVCAISGTNLVEKYTKISDSYFFSYLGGNWGWATWRSEWQRYDQHLTGWPQLKREHALSEMFADVKAVAYWTKIFDSMYDGSGPNTWDYQWFYTHLKNNSLTIVPRYNLVANIGFGPRATHVAEANIRLTPPVATMKFPLKHPSNLIPLRSMDRHIQNLLSATRFQWAARKINRVADALLR